MVGRSTFRKIDMKLLNCPCENAKYCGTMIGSIKLHRVMYNSRFRDFIHSKKGLEYLLSHYDGKTELVAAINDTYKQLK